MNSKTNFKGYQRARPVLPCFKSYHQWIANKRVTWRAQNHTHELMGTKHERICLPGFEERDGATGKTSESRPHCAQRPIPGIAQAEMGRAKLFFFFKKAFRILSRRLNKNSEDIKGVNPKKKDEHIWPC